ncbi:hypothetical protein ON05_036980 (plasmid) [Acaryochloris sp. CCMEE 5410]|nr:hypothetical protein ON05_036980 [Acaryochloris sp. CCMEE 5410]
MSHASPILCLRPLKKTCRKLGVSFWQYQLSRLRADGEIPPLPDMIRAKATATVLVLAST